MEKDILDDDFVLVASGRTTDGNNFSLLKKQVGSRIAMRVKWETEPTKAAIEESRALADVWFKANGMSPRCVVPPPIIRAR